MMGHLRESVNGVIFNKERTALLLIKRRDVPVWVLPGGGIEPGEIPEKAVAREIEEETGLLVKVERKVGEYTPLCRLASFTHLFECRVESGVLLTGPETKAVRFFPLDALPKRLPLPYREWIEEARLPSLTLIRRSITSVTYLSLLKHFFLHPFLIIRFLLTKIGIVFNAR